MAVWSNPASWEWMNFVDVAEIAQDLVSPADVLDQPHIAPNNIGSGDRQLLPYQTVREDGVISPKQRFFPGQILFAKIRPYLLKSVKVDFRGVCSADMYPLWAKQAVIPDYLLLWLTSPDFRDVIAHLQGRTVLPKINQATLNTTPVPTPPVAEQRRIVAKIDRLSTCSKRARDELAHLGGLIARYKSSLLAHEFGEIANARGTLAAYVSDGLIGLVRSKDQQSADRGTPYIRMQHYDLTGCWDFSSLTRVEVSAAEAQRFSLRGGDILFNTRNSSELVGKVAIWPGSETNHVFNNNLLRLRFVDEMNPRFAYLQMRGPRFQDILRGLKSATTSVAAIYQKPLYQLPFWCPKRSTQEEIVSRIERAFAAIDLLAAEAQSARALLDKLDQAILAKAFRGELVPQDPDDEPASVLLERIRAERAAAPAPRRRAPRAAR